MAGMTIGRMRDRVRVEQPTDTRDSRGQPVKTWTPLVETWAAVESLAGKELWQAQQVQSLTTDRVTLYRLACPDLETHGPKWRLVVTSRDNRVLNITSVRRVDASGEYLEVLCAGEGATL